MKAWFINWNLTQFYNTSTKFVLFDISGKKPTSFLTIMTLRRQSRAKIGFYQEFPFSKKNCAVLPGGVVDDCWLWCVGMSFDELTSCHLLFIFILIIVLLSFCKLSDATSNNKYIIYIYKVVPWYSGYFVCNC